VAPITTGIIIHFMFHICCISIHKQFSSERAGAATEWSKLL
jgi:hypothetical protein